MLTLGLRTTPAVLLHYAVLSAAVAMLEIPLRSSGKASVIPLLDCTRRDETGRMDSHRWGTPFTAAGLVKVVRRPRVNTE